MTKKNTQKKSVPIGHLEDVLKKYKSFTGKKKKYYTWMEQQVNMQASLLPIPEEQQIPQPQGGKAYTTEQLEILMKEQEMSNKLTTTPPSTSSALEQMFDDATIRKCPIEDNSPTWVDIPAQAGAAYVPMQATDLRSTLFVPIDDDLPDVCYDKGESSVTASIFEAEAEMASPPYDQDDIDIIHKHLVIERVTERLSIVAVVVDMEKIDENRVNLVPCDGEPLGCYAYDVTHSAYYVTCKYYLELGSIAAAYRIKSQGRYETNNIIALPAELVEKYLTPVQKKALTAFREKHKEPRHQIQLMQSILC